MFGVPRSRGSEGEPPKGGTANQVPSFFQQSPERSRRGGIRPSSAVGLKILQKAKRRSRNVPSGALSKVILCAVKSNRHL